MSLIGACYGINATPDQMKGAIAPKREMGEIYTALKTLEEDLANLNGKIWSIGERLEPVLTPETPTKAHEPEMARLMSPLAVRINSITADVSRANASLEGLIQRLEV